MPEPDLTVPDVRRLRCSQIRTWIEDIPPTRNLGRSCQPPPFRNRTLVRIYNVDLAFVPIYYSIAPSLDVTATPTISLRPYPTSQAAPGFSGHRRTITIVVGAIAAFLLVLLLCLAEYLLWRDRRRRLTAQADRRPVQSLDDDPETRPIPSTVQQALSGYIVDQRPLNLPGPYFLLPSVISLH